MKAKIKFSRPGVFHAKPTGIIKQERICPQCKKDYLSSRSLEQHIQRGHK